MQALPLQLPRQRQSAVLVCARIRISYPASCSFKGRVAALDNCAPGDIRAMGGLTCPPPHILPKSPFRGFSCSDMPKKRRPKTAELTYPLQATEQTSEIAARGELEAKNAHVLWHVPRHVRRRANMPDRSYDQSCSPLQLSQRHVSVCERTE